MTSYVKDGTVGPWAKEKLDCLERYLIEYTRIMSNQDWCEGFYYVDAFAGSGMAPLRSYSSTTDNQPSFFEFDEESKSEVTEYVMGSPHIALGIERPFTKYFFVDRSNDKTENLLSLKEEYVGDRAVDIRTDDAENAIREIISEQDIVAGGKKRGFVFLDPFGMQVKWNTIESIARTQSLEVLINFPLDMAIQRMLPKDGSISAENRGLLDAYFGTSEWTDHVYDQQTDLFNEPTQKKYGDSSVRLVNWYRERLANIFKYTATPRVILNTRGHPIYYLLFAGPNETGNRIVDHILRQGAKIRK